MTDRKTPEVEVLSPAQPGRRRRFTTAQKQRFLDEAEHVGDSISSVARSYGISPSLLLRWKRMRDEGGLAGLDADERVVADTEVRQLKAAGTASASTWCSRSIAATARSSASAPPRRIRPARPFVTSWRYRLRRGSVEESSRCHTESNG
jgi:transposase